MPWTSSKCVETRSIFSADETSLRACQLDIWTPGTPADVRLIKNASEAEASEALSIPRDFRLMNP